MRKLILTNRFPITHHSSLITHHSSLITHHSSLITHHSLLITHHSSLKKERDAHHEPDGDDGKADEAATEPVREPRARIAARDCGEGHHENVRPVDLARRDAVRRGDTVDADGEKILHGVHLVYVREAE